MQAQKPYTDWLSHLAISSLWPGHFLKVIDRNMLIRNQQRSCEYILNFQVFTDSDDTCQGYMGYTGYMGRKIWKAIWTGRKLYNNLFISIYIFNQGKILNLIQCLILFWMDFSETLCLIAVVKCSLTSACSYSMVLQTFCD